MAIEPYKPNIDGRYRDELDREIDQKIDSMFSRWNWKLFRGIRTLLIIAIILWAVVNTLPGLFEFLGSGNVGSTILQVGVTGLSLFFFIGFQFFLMYFFMARTRIYWVKPGETGVSFKDYRGQPEVLEAARRIVILLKGAKEFKQMGGEVTRGVLLVGPPGTGKSYLAQAISTEAGVPFGYLSAPSLQSAWMGMGNVKVMNLYRKARRLAREYGACILFIDEIDAVGGARSASMAGGNAAGMHADNLSGGKQNVVMGGMGMNGGGSGILNELLLQMDPPPRETGMIGKLLRNLGLRRKKVDMPPVLTMGATNLAESLDAALLRPGRFDRKVYVDRPDAEGRREVIEYYLSKVKHEPMPMDRLASDTIHYTPVAIKHVINEAVIHAHFDGRQAINYWDITRARDTHEYGLRNPIRGMSYEERRLIAYHEAGHAYTMMKLLKKERVEKVTIIRHGNALGFAAPKVIEERHLQTKEDLINNITTLLASRAAEEIFLGVKTTGVGSDFPRATYLAAVLIGAVGMEETIYSYNLLDAQGVGAAELRPRVEKLLQTQFRYAKAMLENNKEAVTAIAEALILRNELTDIDLNDILERVEAMHPFVPVKRNETRKFVGFAMPQLEAATTPPARRSRRPAAEPGALPAPRQGDTGKLPPLDAEPADSGENA
jgi:cell division protease FtsH